MHHSLFAGGELYHTKMCSSVEQCCEENTRLLSCCVVALVVLVMATIPIACLVPAYYKKYSTLKAMGHGCAGGAVLSVFAMVNTFTEPTKPRQKREKARCWISVGISLVLIVSFLVVLLCGAYADYQNETKAEIMREVSVSVLSGVLFNVLQSLLSVFATTACLSQLAPTENPNAV